MTNPEAITLTRCLTWEWPELAKLSRLCFPRISADEFSYIFRHHRRGIRIARHGGRIVGYWVNSASFAPEFAWLEQIGVSPFFRHRGLGRLLLQDYEAAVRDQGFRRIEFAVDVDNSPGIGLFRSCGFVVTPRPGPRLTFCKDILGGPRRPGRPSTLDAWLARTWYRALFQILVRPAK